MTPSETMAILAKYKEQNPEGFESFEKAGDFESLAVAAMAHNQATVIQLKPAPTTVEHEQSFPLNIIRTVSAGNGAQVQTTAGASAALPAFTFLGSDSQIIGANYRQSFAAMALDANIIFTSVLPSVNGKDVVFTYQDNTVKGNYETIVLNMADTTSYISLLDESKHAHFKIKHPKFQVYNVLQAVSFGQPLTHLQKYGSGTVTVKDIKIPTTFAEKLTPNYNVQEVPHDFEVDNYLGLSILMAPNAITSPTVVGSTYTMLMSCFLDKIHHGALKYGK